MYRDDPLDDELELRAVVGDTAVDRLAVVEGAVDVALDVMRVLQGWVSDDAVADWFSRPLRRLGDVAPIDALEAGRFDEVEEAGRAWAAANG